MRHKIASLEKIGHEEMSELRWLDPPLQMCADFLKFQEEWHSLSQNLNKFMEEIVKQTSHYLFNIFCVCVWGGGCGGVEQSPFWNFQERARALFYPSLPQAVIVYAYILKKIFKKN